MPLFDLLAINSQSLNSFQQGINLTSKNINNVHNKDYAREEAGFHELSTYGTYMAQAHRVFDQRYFDRYLKENQSLNFHQEMSSSLESIENIFNDIHGSGFADDLNAYYKALNDIVAQPDNIGARNDFLEKAKGLISQFGNAYESLDNEKQNVQLSMKEEIKKINDLTASLAHINKAIGAQPRILVPNQEERNSLLNERDKILKELSSHIDLKVRYNANNTVDVFSAKGHALVVGNRHFQLAHTTQEKVLDGGLKLYTSKITIDGSDLTKEFSKGTLAAKLHVDGILDNTIEKLNTLAITFANENNSVHKMGKDLEGNPAKALFINKNDGSETFNVTNISLAIEDPRKIGASLDGTPSDNDNAKALYRLGKDKFAALENRTFYDAYIDIVQNLGSQKAYHERVAQQREQIVQTLDAKLQEISGVNLDEELVNLSQLQKSYQAAARVINVTNQLLDVVMDIIH